MIFMWMCALMFLLSRKQQKKGVPQSEEHILSKYGFRDFVYLFSFAVYCRCVLIYYIRRKCITVCYTEQSSYSFWYFINTGYTIMKNVLIKTYGSQWILYFM
jgi:hypothetical protein